MPQTIPTFGTAGQLSFSAPTETTLRIDIESDGVLFTFTGKEDGKFISLELAPERNITAYEQLLLSNIIATLTIGIFVSPEMFLWFVRKNNLERHFKFNAA
jgi:hypothetical protein